MWSIWDVSQCRIWPKIVISSPPPHPADISIFSKCTSLSKAVGFDERTDCVKDRPWSLLLSYKYSRNYLRRGIFQFPSDFAKTVVWREFRSRVWQYISFISIPEPERWKIVMFHWLLSEWTTTRHRRRVARPPPPPEKSVEKPRSPLLTSGWSVPGKPTVANPPPPFGRKTELAPSSKNETLRLCSARFKVVFKVVLPLMPPSGMVTIISSRKLAVSRISQHKVWPIFNPVGGLPDTIRTVSGSRLLSRARIRWTPLQCLAGCPPWRRHWIRPACPSVNGRY